MEIYRIVGQYKVRYCRENVSALDDFCETITEIMQGDEQGFFIGPSFFSRGNGKYHVKDMIPGGTLFLGHTLKEAIDKLKAESAM